MSNTSSHSTHNELIKCLETQYNENTYDAGISMYAHPYLIAARAALCGIIPPSIKEARILEIGCGIGNNLIPIAESLPHSVCIGVDISKSQIQQAQKTTEALKLNNIIFIEGDILTLTQDLGPFDYIIAHGVYSWVPESVRNQLFNTCAQMLDPSGILYMSYNTYPGWHDFNKIRGVFKAFTAHKSDPFEGNFRRNLDQWCAKIPQGYTHEIYKNLWSKLFHRLPDFYLKHGIFGTFNTPKLLLDVVEHAVESNLHYLIDCDLGKDLPTSDSPFLDMEMDVPALQRIQLFDYFNHTSFRSSLFGFQTETWDYRNFCLNDLNRLYLVSNIYVSHIQIEASDTQDRQYLHRTHNQPEISVGSQMIDHVIHVINEHWPEPVSIHTVLSHDHLGAYNQGELLSLIFMLCMSKKLEIIYEFDVQAIKDLHNETHPIIKSTNRALITSHNHTKIYNHLHQLVPRMSQDPWIHFFDWLDGTRTPNELLASVTSHPLYPNSVLSQYSTDQQRELLAHSLSVCFQSGLLMSEYLVQ